MVKKKIPTILFLTSALLTLSACSSQDVKTNMDHANPIKNVKKTVYSTHKNMDGKLDQINDIGKSERQQQMKPFGYLHGKKKLVLAQFDSLGRARGAHIQLKESQTPHVKRSVALTYKPVGYHNKRFTYKGKQVWAYNRGHLVGWQFSGLNNTSENLITQTTYLNQGGLDGMDDKNPKGQLYYENKLRSWMKQHPNDSLDYSVVPIYKHHDLVPIAVKLTFVGYTPTGKETKVNVGGKAHGKTVQHVILKNTSPGIKINYSSGYIKLDSKN